MTTASDHRLTFTQLLSSTALSACISRTLTAPLDVLKITKQVGTVESKSSLQSLCKHLRKHDGVRGWWKGNMIGCIKVLPHSWIHYLIYQQLKWEFSDELGRLSIGKRLSTGIAAGIVSTVAVYPLDVVKTRTIIQPYDKTISAYKGVTDTFQKILLNEGKGIFYKGLLTTLIGSVPYAITTFLMYEILDQLWIQPRYNHSTVEVMLHGCLATAAAMTVSFPFDVVRRKMQAQSPVLVNNGGVDVTFKGAKDCLRAIAHFQGIKGFWQGLTPALIRVFPYHALMFLSFDLCKKICLYQNGYSQSMIDHAMDQNIDLDELQEILDYDIELPQD
ncbi:solute carrier family 25 member 43-like [Mytilus edulis]|uniref:solute carrier family 25 member 43-like n=1 Tax=Mytilus edulis TaxID=6550 RepID=UPI0039EFDDFB